MNPRRKPSHHHQNSPKDGKRSFKPDTPSSIKAILADKQSPMTPSPYVQFQPLNPIWRLSPWHNSSTLYDSYELQAVTHQLNKAIKGSNGSSLSPFMSHLKSPFYRQRLDHIYKENAKTPRKIPCTQSACAALDKKPSVRSARGFVARLWKKVKRGLVRNKQRIEG